MHPSLRHTDHRPWELPRTPWHWRQSWCDLLFAHWPVPAEALRGLVPERVQIQEFDGTSWVGVVPFRMQGVMLRSLPEVPGISAFPELNLRLYVEVDGKPGVWFISLDATNRLAVLAARRLFYLPYFHARMEMSYSATQVRYDSERRSSQVRVAFRGSYGPTGEIYEAKRGTLEHFLTERYCLYTQSPEGMLLRADVHHRPWPLQPAAAEIEENTVASAQGIPASGPPALLHYSQRIDVVVWPPKACECRVSTTQAERLTENFA